jgi:XTP/dITP diphosphohydrolase/tetrapyrrole methylase family protein/MazG family protein
VIAKMERRNPHVFGDAEATDAAAVLRLWNAAKAAEKAEKAEKAEQAEQAGTS